MREVKALLQMRMHELVAQLCPGGRREGRYWIAPNPRRANDRAGSFFVWLTGPAAGGWKEADAGDVEKGDIFQLIQYTGQAADMKEALAWAKQWLGITRADAPTIVRLKEQAEKTEREISAAELKRQAAAKRYAVALWLEAAELGPRTMAWRYLEDARGIPIRRLIKDGGLRCLRAHPRLQYVWPAPERLPVSWRARRPMAGEETFPALVACMSPGEAGTNSGIHRTYLRQDGLGKANVIKAKKMLGQQLGCAVKLWRGESGLSARDAAARGVKGTVVFCEGIEDGLSCAVSTPEHRVWALGSLAALGSIAYPKCASEVVIFAHNDWNKPQAVRALDEAAQRLAQCGPVRIARAPAGAKDANDLLNQDEASPRGST